VRIERKLRDVGARIERGQRISELAVNAGEFAARHRADIELDNKLVAVVESLRSDAVHEHRERLKVAPSESARRARGILAPVVKVEQSDMKRSNSGVSNANIACLFGAFWQQRRRGRREYVAHGVKCAAECKRCVAARVALARINKVVFAAHTSGGEHEQDKHNNHFHKIKKNEMTQKLNFFVIAVVLTFVIAFAVTTLRHSGRQEEKCTLLFIDLGASVGDSLKSFYTNVAADDETFASASSQYRRRVGWRDDEPLHCIVAVEGNGALSERLHRSVSELNVANRIVVLAETVASGSSAPFETFYVDETNEQVNFWASSVVRERAPRDARAVRANNVRVGELIEQMVDARQCRAAGGCVAIKIDIEGAEYEVLASMLVDGSARWLTQLFVEWHPLPRHATDRLSLPRHLQPGNLCHGALRQLIEWLLSSMGVHLSGATD
jgi:FkbM family methyltransferase